MIRRLLIANRGEIACRIARTARAMGIETVAVHSDADAGAAHVMACDSAVRIGPAPVSESYLRGEALIEAAKATGADAVHPGYGFLSENPGFAEAVETAGLTWVGPPASAIRAMGLKDAAKRLMEEAGVPVTPGYHGDQQDAGFLTERAAEIGYPVLIKASAGGGGKGMRKVDGPDGFAAALERARSEAASAFGHDHVLVEKFIENPRHIEVQVFADARGSAVHLYERDCSCQRRHQKVIEEAPAPGMTAELREAMCTAAVRAAEAVSYRGAGTVEFIVDGGAMSPDAFFFMEMNTRLQVEHPVTEEITGVDLVEWQLRVAAGEPLPLAQDEIPLNGHALEVRLYAEDPARDFMPQTGRLDALVLDPAARVESGVRPGDDVTPHYDPMIAKLITHGPDRRTAFEAMSRVLAASHVAGCVTNLGFLERLVADGDVRAGKLDTGLIARRIDTLTGSAAPTPLDAGLLAGAIAGLLDPGPLTGWRAWGQSESMLDLEIEGTPLTVRLGACAAGTTAVIPGGSATFRASALAGAIWQVESDGLTERVAIHIDPLGATLVSPRGRLRAVLADPARAEDAGAGGDDVRAPLPGILRSLTAGIGDSVEPGQTVAVMEAMKMEHALEAPRAGRIAEIGAAEGDSLAEGALILTLEPLE